MYIPGNANSRKACEEFIDKVITCEKLVDSEFPAIQYQIHKHTRTCKRKTNEGTVCRFHIPWFPMDRTTIFEPFNKDELDEVEREFIEQHYKRVRTMLGNMYKTTPDISFNEFLLQVNLNKDEYYNVVRFSISRPTVILKREVKAIRVNAYNKTILQCWQANMDIQFILDVYSCANYVINYISKSRGELSNLIFSNSNIQFPH